MRRVPVSTHQDDGVLWNVGLVGFGKGGGEMGAYTRVSDEEILLFAFFVDFGDVEDWYVRSCCC